MAAESKTEKTSFTRKMTKTARNGFFIFLMTLFISGALIALTYLPWKAYMPIERSCTEPVTATVIGGEAQIKDGGYYYGPQIEFTVYADGRTLRVYAVNTVNLNRTWEDGKAIPIYYDPDDPTQAVLRDEHTAENHFKAARYGAIVLSSLGFIVMIAGVIIHFKNTAPKKYRSNIAGQSFEEWQAQQTTAQDTQTEESKMDKTEAWETTEK